METRKHIKMGVAVVAVALLGGVASCAEGAPAEGPGVSASTAPVESTTSSAAPPVASTIPVTTTLPVTTTVAPGDESLVGFPFGALEAGARITDVFPLAVSLELGDGWSARVPENRFLIDLGHESGGRFVLSLARWDVAVVEAINVLQEQAGFEEGGLEVVATSEISVAGRSGTRAVAAIEGTTNPFIRALTPPRTLEGFLVLQIPVTMWVDVLDIDGKTLIVYAEAHPEHFASFIVDVIEPIHASMTIG